MPQTLVGTKNCPHIYHEDIAIASEAEFCDIDDKRCAGCDCIILHEIKKKKENKIITGSFTPLVVVAVLFAVMLFIGLYVIIMWSVAVGTL